MIDAKELRIGNWVDCDGFGQVNLNFFDILFIKQYKRFKPIPLSPELLIKCGFAERVWDNANYKGKEYILEIDNWALRYKIDYVRDGKKVDLIKFIIEGDGCYDEAGEYDILEKVKYLHQLQNLHFALTQKELEVNL